MRSREGREEKPLTLRVLRVLPVQILLESCASDYGVRRVRMMRAASLTMISIVSVLLLFTCFAAVADPPQIPDPGQEDTCPVCGMFVAKYPEWVATVVYKDGHTHHFDGAKDLFKYLLELSRWAPGHKSEDIGTIAVTEYYGLTRISARDAWYVIGSDVLGPMGHELIPLASQDDADEFARDHSGWRVLRFDAVNLDLLKALDDGRFK